MISLTKILALAPALLLAGCLLGKPDDIEPWDYTNKDLRYSLTFPAEWGWFENSAYDVYAISPEKDSASFHVRANSVDDRLADPRTLQELVVATVLRDEELHGTESVVFPAEQRGSRTVIPTLSFFVSEGITYTNKTLYFERGDYFGYIEFIGPSSRFSHDLEIQGVDSSLTFF
jgi:hypothetical protein